MSIDPWWNQVFNSMDEDLEKNFDCALIEEAMTMVPKEEQSSQSKQGEPPLSKCLLTLFAIKDKLVITVRIKLEGY